MRFPRLSFVSMTTAFLLATLTSADEPPALKKAEDKDHGVLTIDRAHKNDAGNKLIADTILNSIDR